jgi:hypothetical protein
MRMTSGNMNFDSDLQYQFLVSNESFIRGQLLKLSWCTGFGSVEREQYYRTYLLKRPGAPGMQGCTAH